MNFSIVYFFNSLTQSYPYLATSANFISGPLSYFLFPLFFLSFLIIKNKNHLYWFSLVFLSGFLAWFLAVILKNIFRINRPFIEHSILFPLRIESGFSFPSEHASVYGALTFLAWRFDYRLGIITTIVAILVIFSRLFSGVHYPIDLVIGYILGFFISFCIAFFFKKYI